MTESLQPSPSSPAPVESPPADLEPRAPAWRAILFDLLLVALLWVGIYFRFNWVNWSQDTDLHPDEYGLTSTLTRLRLPESLDEYFNTRLSPISPYQKYDGNGQPTEPGPDNRMRWGQWPIILLKLGAEVMDRTGYGEQRLLGRSLSALADTLSLFLIFLIGARLYNRRLGLLAAALSALAVMPIQQSHFMTSDNFGALFTLAALYCAVRVATAAREATPRRDTLWYVLFGLAFGMAMASRVNLLPLAGMIVLAAAIAHYDDYRAGRLDGARVLSLLVLAGVVSALTFRVTQPMSFRAETGDTTLFTFRPNPDWVASMEVSAAESSLQGGGPPAEQWTGRIKLLFPWLNMVLWGMGLPLGLAAWAGLGWAAWRCLKTDEWRAHLLPVVWAGGYFLFMGTRWVMSVRYFLPIYHVLALLAAWGLYELWHKAQESRARAPGAPGPLWLDRLPLVPLSFALFFVVLGGTLAWAWGFTSIYRTENTRVQASRWIYANVPAAFHVHLETPDGVVGEPLPFPSGMQLSADAPYRLELTPRTSGTVIGLTLARAVNAANPDTGGRVRIVLASDPEGNQPLAEAEMVIMPAGSDQRGGQSSAALGPVPVAEGQRYYLLATASADGPIAVSGSVLANESWDEGLPLRLDGRDGFGGLYQGLTMEVRWGDDENKRQMFLDRLRQVDFIILPSQRGLWSSSRLPLAYPMTLEYYRALFDGRLGFELAGEFQSPITLGPLRISDVAGTWAWGAAPDLTPNPNDPFNDNLFAAEEAFSVYDHAPVWIFRKRADFRFDRAAALLAAIDLSQAVNQGPREASRAPRTRLMLPDDLRAEQRAGGTWSEMFDPASPLNASQPLGVGVWYAALLLIGWLAFPLTFAAFGGLADRGYALAKAVGLLFVAWLVWMLASLRVLPHTRGSLALGLLALAGLSALVVWRRRAEIGAYLREHRRHIAIVEGLTLALFLFMLLIRWGNPDLWHPWKGGEKPMDFSYFNAVLKSTYFPPYDPWLAGGYINYYYYGYVIAGVPTKLLGIVPSFAYNLLLPTLFALTGINAFAAAYNLVAGSKDAGATTDVQPETSNSPDQTSNDQAGGQREAPVGEGGQAPTIPSPDSPIAQSPITVERPGRASAPSPYLAGLAAALLIVVLGNLAQVRTFIVAFQRSADRGALAESALGDNELTATVNGLWRVATGQTTLALSLDSMYWDASRVVDYTNGDGGNEINEFPLFTFLYADLHAHMISLPFTVLALAWAAAYVLGVSRRRAWWESAALFALGGLAIGVARPTNTWDYPVYLTLGAAAIAGGHVLRDGLRLTRDNLIGLAWRAAVLIGLAVMLYYPYDQWFYPAYTEAELWRGTKTNVESYLYIHGLFLFALVTFLIVETRRWLDETPARVVGRAGDWAAAAGLFALAFVVVLGVLVIAFDAVVALVALPLMAWAGLLIVRAPERLAPAKRVALFLLGTGLAITIVVELVVLSGDIGRQNTIFKFYMQVWTMFSVAAGAALAWAWADRARWRLQWRTGWTAGLALLTAAAGLYTLTAAQAKMRDRFPSFGAQPYGTANAGCQQIQGMALPYNPTLRPEDQPRSLDGLDYMQWTAYCDETYFLPLAYDRDAINWLNLNVQGSPVIVEAYTSEYRLGARYAWNTGLPDVIGWNWHQRQQRGVLPTEFIPQRAAEVASFFTTPDPAAAAAFLREYDVRYVIVGPMEQAYYPPDGLAKFQQMAQAGQLSIAYRNGGVTIYEVRPIAAGN